MKDFIKLAKLSLVICLTVILIFEGLIWLAILTLLVMASYYKFFQKKKFGARSLLGIFCLAILTRVFIFEIYNIPSPSMEDNLIAGDIIFVSKLNYGPKLPETINDIPWINLLFGQRKRFEWPSGRFSGFSMVKHNEIIVFKRLNRGNFLVKRCIGMPGDNVMILNKNIYINGKILEPIPGIKQLYKVDVKKFTPVADSLHIIYNLGRFDQDLRFAETELNSRDANLIQAKDSSSCNPLLAINGKTYLHQFFHWTIDNFGPVKIPAKNMSIKLTDTTYILYKEIMETYEKTPIYRSHTGFYTKDGHPLVYYKFKYNYYFLLGDNRSNSDDSRFWGFLPETQIEGKAICTLFSASNGTFRWNRLLKKL